MFDDGRLERLEDRLSRVEASLERVVDLLEKVTRASGPDEDAKKTTKELREVPETPRNYKPFTRPEPLKK